MTESDRETVLLEINTARSNGNKVINIAPQNSEPQSIIDYCIEQIKSGERILITLPRIFTHDKSVRGNYEAIEDLCQDYSMLSELSEDIFFAFRHKRDKDCFIFDLYHL